MTYSESLTNVVKKKLRLDPQMNHSKGQTLKHAPWPSLCMSLEDRPPVGEKEYGQTSRTFPFGLF